MRRKIKKLEEENENKDEERIYQIYGKTLETRTRPSCATKIDGKQ